jgi:glycosyltransferase involved in cell wall biosynthesis
MVKVSILIATYNYGAYIKECLDSIAEQTLEDYEIIIYDDASTDDTKSFLSRRFMNPHILYTNITVIYGVEQVGQSRAKNAALAAAEGEYIFFLDADNYFATDDALGMFVEALDKDPKAGFAYCDRVGVGTRTGIIKSAPISSMIYNGNYIDGNMLSRKDAFGEYDEELVKLTDWDRILHMLTNGWKGAYLRSPLIAYRFHDRNTGTVHMDRHRAMTEHIMQKYKNKRVRL